MASTVSGDINASQRIELYAAWREATVRNRPDRFGPVRTVSSNPVKTSLNKMYLRRNIKYHTRWMLATLMFLAGSLSGCSSIRSRFGNGLATNGVPNFAEVEPANVFRGGQPNSRGWEYLRTLGVKTVVKLDYSDEGADDEARNLGMTVIDAEMQSKGFIHWSGSPKANLINVAKAEVALSYESKWPIYVHCLYGEDRTGLVVGEFRVLHDDWRTNDAYAEMRALGFHPEIYDLHELWERFVRDHSVRPFSMENRSGATEQVRGHGHLLAPIVVNRPPIKAQSTSR